MRGILTLRTRALVPAALLLARLAAAAEGEDSDPRAGAWDRSVALETKGELAAAEREMVREWGEQSDSYWVGLRRAYLALLQQRYQEARSRYRSLRERPEAEGDQDVVRGLASATAGCGWTLAAQGSVTDARAAFREALLLDPNNESAKLGLDQVPTLPIVEPEVWSGLVTQALGMNHYQGWVLYGHVPVRLTDLLVLRVAGRYVSFSESSRGSPWAFGPSGKATWSLNEQYLGLAYPARSLGGDLVVARADSSLGPAILGAAGRLRLGSTWGFLIEGAVLHARNVAANAQVRPMLFAYLGKYLGLQAGTRLTFDDRGNGASASAGASILVAPVAIHLQGHAGRERWAVGLAGPSVLSFNVTTSYGGGVTLIWDVIRELRLAVQAEGERLQQEGARGVYGSFSGGIQVPLGAR